MLIAGGGIGGLTAALSLTKIGAHVTVFEKRHQALEEGAGIQIGPNGTRILHRLGLSEALKPHIASPIALSVSDGSSGRHLTSLPLGQWIADRHGSPYWVAHRADLHAALRGAVENHPCIDLRTGVEISRAKTLDNEVFVECDGDIVGAGDLLIAADGVRSGLRKEHFSNAPLRYSGKSAARSVIAADRVPTGIPTDQVGIWLSPFGHVVHYPVRGGNELAVVVIKNELEATQDWCSAVSSSWVQIAVENFPIAVRNLIDSADNWRKWALYELPPLDGWVKNRMALLGDAAHPVLPFLAQGAVLAMEDAETLARCLSESAPADVADALQSYQTARMPRARRVQQASRENGGIYHLDGPMRTARNLTLSYAPASQLIARYDWLYGWRTEV